MLCREAALTVILIKGGLELNANQLRRLSGVVARLTVLPCVAEAVAAGVAAHFLLPGFSLVWGLTLGCVVYCKNIFIIWCIILKGRTYTNNFDFSRTQTKLCKILLENIDTKVIF